MFNYTYLHENEVWCTVRYTCVLPFYGLVESNVPIRMTKDNYDKLKIAVDIIPSALIHRVNIKDYYYKTALIDNVVEKELAEELPSVNGTTEPDTLTGITVEDNGDVTITINGQSVTITPITLKK